MKKHLIILIVLVMLLMSSFTVSAYTEGYFNYEVKDGSVIITEYFGKSKEVTVPAMIAGNPVNTIAEGAFQGTDVEKLLLPDTIMEIEEDAIPSNVEVVYNSNVPDKSYSDKVETDSDTTTLNNNSANQDATNKESGKTDSSKPSSTDEEPKWNSVISKDETEEQEEGELVLSEMEEFADEDKKDAASNKGKWPLYVASTCVLVILAVGCFFFVRFKRKSK